MTDLILSQECYQIVGAAMAVYNALGSGFLEAVYQEALEIELTMRKIPFEAQRDIHIVYRSQTLQKTYTADFLVFGQMIVEIKAADELISVHEAQLLNYLKATKLPLGLLINFGHSKKLEWKRMAHTLKYSTNFNHSSS